MRTLLTAVLLSMAVSAFAQGELVFSQRCASAIVVQRTTGQLYERLSTDRVAVPAGTYAIICGYFHNPTWLWAYSFVSDVVVGIGAV